MLLSEELLGFIPIPLSGTRNKKMNLRFEGRRMNCCKAVSLWTILTQSTRMPQSVTIRFEVDDGKNMTLRFKSQVHFLPRNLSV